MKILFYLAKPYALACTQTLRELVRAKEGCESLCFSPEKLLPHLPDEHHTSIIQQASEFKPDIVFCPGNYVHDAIPGIKVQLFHGLGYEKKGHFAIRHFFQVYCTPGPVLTERFEALARKHKSFFVVETGWPKVDLLFQNQEHTDKKLENLPKDKKIILYAPTFSRKLTSVPKIMNQLKRLPREDEFFLIKLHDLHNREERTFLKKLPQDRFRVVDDPNITPYLKAADILVSDTSSVVYEFALLKSAIVLIEPKRTDFPVETCKAPFLRESLDKAREPAPEREAGLQAMMDRIHPWRDTGSAERIFDSVCNTDFLERAKQLPKKTNWFRRLKFRYYDLFKKGYVK